MKEQYYIFNQDVFDRFFSQEHYESFLFISANEIEELLARVCKDKIYQFIRQNNNWEKFFFPSSPPMYLGLIAVQIYIAAIAQRKDDKGNKGKVPYYPHSEGIFNSIIFSKNEQQIKLWQLFQQFCLKKGLKTPKVPDKGDKYVKYPISQAILNTDDYLRIAKIWHDKGIDYEEEYDSDYLLALLYEKKYSSIYKKICRHMEQGYIERIHELLDAFFKQWNGQIDKVVYNHGSKPNYKKQFVMTYYPDDDESLHITYDNESSTLENLWKRKKNRLGYVYLQKCMNYPADWVYRSKLDISCAYCIITCNTDQCFDSICDSVPFEIDGYYIYMFPLEKLYILKKHIPSEFSEKPLPIVTLHGGIMLDRDTWLQGAGPHIVTNAQKGTLHMTSKSSEIELTPNSLVSLRVGTYMLSVNGALIRFYIKDIAHVTIEAKFGWAISKLCPNDEDWDMSGCLLISQKDEYISRARYWIERSLYKVKMLNTRQWIELHVMENDYE